MTPTTTDRDRLTHAFADLRRHGIEARAALPASVPEGHAGLRAELARRFPAGMGSYVFWTHSDEVGLDAAGALNAPVTLHCSTADVAVAVAAACRRAGIAVQPDGRATALRIAPPRE
jgi:hypothetical protein